MAPAIEYEAFLVSLPTHDSLATAIDGEPTVGRELVFVRATDGDGSHGWGECSALNAPGYTPEWARGAFGLLTSGFPITPARYPLAFAGLEMAELDLTLKNRGESLASHLGVRRSHVPAGAVVGLGSPDETVGRVASLVSAGYKRVKLKITSGKIVDRVETIRRRFPEVELQVDANGSLDESDLSDLAHLAELQVTVIEQPFAVADQELTRRLRDVTDTLVFADEAVRTVADAQARPHYDGLVVKPGPSGGLQGTLELLAHATREQLQLSAGGMLESGLGRHFLAAVSGLDQFGITGDLSPAGRWLAADPFDDLQMSDGEIAIPIAPGVAPAPDADALKRFTLAQGRVLLQQ